MFVVVLTNKFIRVISSWLSIINRVRHDVIIQRITAMFVERGWAGREGREGRGLTVMKEARIKVADLMVSNQSERRTLERETSSDQHRVNDWGRSVQQLWDNREDVLSAEVLNMNKSHWQSPQCGLHTYLRYTIHKICPTNQRKRIFHFPVCDFLSI